MEGERPASRNRFRSRLRNHPRLAWTLALQLPIVVVLVVLVLDSPLCPFEGEDRSLRSLRTRTIDRSLKGFRTSKQRMP